MTKAQKGIYAATVTPVDADGNADLPKLAQYAHSMIDGGLTGVAPAGTTGEGNSIPMAQRLQMPSVFAQAGLPKDRVIFGTGACAAADAAALTRACVDAGYMNTLVLPPFYYKSTSDDGLFAYFAQIIEQIADERLRLYLYHFPQMSMTPVSVPLIQRLKAAFGPIIAGLKDSSGDYAATVAFAQAADDFDVFPSNEGAYVQGRADGCAGVISATVNAAPHLLKSLIATGDATDQANATALRQAIAQFPLMSALKQIQAWKSGDDSWVRTFPPIVPLSNDQTAALQAALNAFEDKTGVHVISN